MIKLNKNVNKNYLIIRKYDLIFAYKKYKQKD